jgi:hypothetical protein
MKLIICLILATAASSRPVAFTLANGDKRPTAGKDRGGQVADEIARRMTGV